MRLPPDFLNPFCIANCTDDNQTLPPGNIPDLYINILNSYRKALVQVKQKNHPLGFTTIGAPGSGKSNLIAQFGVELKTDPSTVLLPLRLSNVSSGFIWQPLQSRFFSQLLNPYDSNQGIVKSPLTRIVQNRVQGWSPETAGANRTLIDIVTGHQSSNLKRLLQSWAIKNPNASISVELPTLIPMIVENSSTPTQKFLASAWLRGESLTKEQLDEIDLPENFGNNKQREQQSQQLITSVLQLAGNCTTLVLCFDEIEAIQAGSEDVQVLREFTFLTQHFLSIPGPRLIMISIRPDLFTKISRYAEESWKSKMKHGINIPPLSLEQAKQLVRKRLESAGVPDSVRSLKPGDLHWPPGTEFLEELDKKHPKALNPRFVLNECAQEVERLLENAFEEPQPPPPSYPPDPYPHLAAFFARTWNQRREQRLGRLQMIDLQRCICHALPWLAQVQPRRVKLLTESESQYDDIERVFVRREAAVPRHRVGVASCHQGPRSIWQRFRRLSHEFANTPSGCTFRLFALRPEWNTLSAAAQNHVDTFVRAGGIHYPVSRNLAAEWSAYDSMLQDVQTGSLVAPGVPNIAQEDFNRWARENLSDCVCRLLRDLFDWLEQQGE